MPNGQFYSLPTINGQLREAVCCLILPQIARIQNKSVVHRPTEPKIRYYCTTFVLYAGCLLFVALLSYYFTPFDTCILFYRSTLAIITP